LCFFRYSLNHKDAKLAYRGQFKGQIVLGSAVGKVKLGDVYLAGVDGLRGERVSRHIEISLQCTPHRLDLVRPGFCQSLISLMNCSARSFQFVLRLLNYRVIAILNGFS